MAKSQSIVNKLFRATEVLKHLSSLTEYTPNNTVGSLKNLEKYIKIAKTANKAVEDLRNERAEKGSKRIYNYYKGEHSILVRLEKVLAYLSTMKSSAELPAVIKSIQAIRKTVVGKKRLREPLDKNTVDQFSKEASKNKSPRKAKGALFHYNWLELSECIKHLQSLGLSYNPSVAYITIVGLSKYLDNLAAENAYINDLDSQTSTEMHKRDLALDQIKEAIVIANGYLKFKYGKKSEAYKRFQEIK